MIEEIVIGYLNRKGFAAYGEEPRTETAYPWYVVEKTSGDSTEHLRRAVLAVQSYGATMYEAAAANQAMIPALLGIVELNSIAGVNLNSDYNFTDTATKRYRYQAVFEITYYEEGF